MGSSITLIIHSLDPTRLVLECHTHLANEPLSIPDKFICRAQNDKYVIQTDLLCTSATQIRLSDTKREICPTIRFVGHGCPTNPLVANETGNMSNKSVSRAQNGKYAIQMDLLCTSTTQIGLSDTKREICPTTRFVGHGWPTNSFVANRTRNISNKPVCCAQTLNKSICC